VSLGEIRLLGLGVADDRQQVQHSSLLGLFSGHVAPFVGPEQVETFMNLLPTTRMCPRNNSCANPSHLQH
jgi:hypothetical protein